MRESFASKANPSFILTAIAMVLTAWLTSATALAESRASDALRSLPVQDAGRVKPYATFAEESLELVYGSDSYLTNKGDRRPAVEIVMTWMLLPQYWDQQKLVRIDHKGLKDSLKLPAEEKYFSPAEILANPRTSLIFQELGSFRATKQKLTPYYQAVQRLESQLGTYQSIKLGQSFRVVPPKPEAAKSAPDAEGRMGEPEKWTPVAELQGEMQAKFARVIHALIQSLPNTDEAAQAAQNASAGSNETLEQAMSEFVTAARAENPSLYPAERDIAIEVHERALHPFKITWVLYLIAGLLLAISWHLGSKRFYQAGWTMAILGFMMHIYGFGLRCYIMGRPPVSNMYESVIWVSAGAFVFAMALEATYRRRYILLAGTIVGVLCLIVADLAPTILDSSLQPLEPVLRSNMWLTVHVLTITLSYSAYFLAWCLGNIGLAMLLKGESPTGERLKMLTQSIYRAIQVGVVLLAAGIILGGIWADYSWGRFWGWDPKETWALIALLGYLAMLHGRLAGWVRAVGLMVWSVVAFNLVIMAWYGVNFVLGAGLHTYGMGAGGVQYVGGFVLLNLVFVGYVVYVNGARSRAIVS